MTPIVEPLDLDSFEDMLTSDLAIKNPSTGAPTSAVITVLGPEHPARKKIQFDRARRMRAEFSRSGKLAVRDPVEDIEQQTDYLVGCTLGWSGMTSGGTALAFSADAARALYTNPKRQWLRAQVIAALDEPDRFIHSSSKT